MVLQLWGTILRSRGSISSINRSIKDALRMAVTAKTSIAPNRTRTGRSFMCTKSCFTPTTFIGWPDAKVRSIPFCWRIVSIRLVERVSLLTILGPAAVFRTMVTVYLSCVWSHQVMRALYLHFRKRALYHLGRNGCRFGSLSVSEGLLLSFLSSHTKVGGTLYDLPTHGVGTAKCTSTSFS